MGIDYRANYGVGYKVEGTDDLTEEDLEHGLGEYVDCECEAAFDSFENGSAYSGNIEGVYLCIKDPFKDGLDLTNAKDRLDKEIERLKLKAVSDFNEVGGLYVY